MTIDPQPTTSPAEVGFHPGERAVQERAGVSLLARRLEGMLDPHGISAGMTAFLATQTFAVLTARDSSGRLWSSPLTSNPGFLSSADHGQTLLIDTVARAGDPLEHISIGQQVGVLVIDLMRRRRVRVNGVLTAKSRTRLAVTVSQAFGNCPQYIYPPNAKHQTAGTVMPNHQGSHLTQRHEAWINATSTMFLGTTHPTRGVDSSHRGGDAGFIEVHDQQLTWPDYPGNNMFNSLGNLAVDPTASILFFDFATGASLHLSGTAIVDWSPRHENESPTVERATRFAVEAVRELS